MAQNSLCFNDIKNQFIDFSKKLDSQIQELQEKELISSKDIERMKLSTKIYKDYLARALDNPSLDSVQIQLFQTYFNDYKKTMTHTINDWWSRLYSDDNFKHQIKESLDEFYTRFASKISENESSLLDKKLAEIETTMYKEFKKELKKQGEIKRYEIGQKFIAESLPQILGEIETLYRSQIVQISPHGNNTKKPPNHQQRSQSSKQRNYNNFNFFENLGKGIDNVINDIFGRNT